MAALHGPRLRMMLEKTTDTTVRGVVYEAAGTVAADVLAGGAAEAEHARRTNEIPYALLEADPGDRAAWLAAARAADRRAALGTPRRVAPAARARRSRYAREHLNPDRDHYLSRREPPVADYAKDVLVDTQWLEEHLDDDSIRIVEVDENPALYAEAHIPGAIGFDWKKDLQDPVKRDFLGPEAFGELFGSRGITNDHTIVLYGDRNNWFAAYTYWYLKYYGHDAVKLLNGPREKWIGEGRPTTTDVPSPSAATFTAQRGDDAIRAKRDEVLDVVTGNGKKLVDVRSPQEFSGELIAMAGYEQEGAQRGGHIPGAASVPWAQAVQEDGTFKSADELARALRRQGRPDRRPDHRLLPHRRALGAHVVRAPRAPRRGRRQELRRVLDGVGEPRGRADREGRLGQAHQEVGEDPGRRAPDEVGPDRSALVWCPVHDERVRPEGDAPAQQPAASPPCLERRERELEHVGHLGRRRRPAVAGLDEPDEGVDRVARRDRRRRLQGSDDLDRARGQPDLLLRLAQRGEAQVAVGRVLAPTRERDLARVAAQVVAAPGQDRVDGVVAVEEERHEDGRVRAAEDVEVLGPDRVEQHRPQAGGDGGARLSARARPARHAR